MNYSRRYLAENRHSTVQLTLLCRYLKKEGLWCRTPVQSFIEDSESKVDRICSKDGRRLADTVTYPGNLCISSSDMLIYEVTIRKTNKGCDIDVSQDSRPAIVACDKVENRCLPVHFQRYEHQSPSKVPCSPARFWVLWCRSVQQSE